MAAFVVSKLVNNFRELAGNASQRVSDAVWPSGEQGRKSQQILMGQPDFIIEGLTDTDTASSACIDLSAQGVAFPADHARMIVVNAYVADNDGVGLVQGKAIVLGGATPVVGQDNIDADAVKTAGLGTAPTLDIDEVSNAVTIDAVGVTDVDIRWVIHVFVGELIRLPFVATT